MVCLVLVCLMMKWFSFEMILWGVRLVMWFFLCRVVSGFCWGRWVGWLLGWCVGVFMLCLVV